MVPSIPSRISGTVLVLVLIVAALIPSAYMAWTWRAMPHFGVFHDDALLFVTAKAHAEGDGHRLPSFPGEPAHTKYPPLVPLLFSLAWQVNPEFPDNLPVAMALAWLAMPLFILAAALWFKELDFARWKIALLCAWLALNPVVAIFSLLTMTDLYFATLLLLSILAAERASRGSGRLWLAVLAGALAGLACLTRVAALPLLVTAPACFLWRKQFRLAIGFAATMVPFVVGWQLWSAMNRVPGEDAVTLYYTNYMAFHVNVLTSADLLNLVMTNISSVINSVSKIVLFTDEDTMSSIMIGRVVTLVVVAGCVRLAKRTGKLQFPAYALAYSLILFQWHYPSQIRFVMPMAALVAAGFVDELVHLSGAVRNNWRKPLTSNKATAVVFASVLLLFISISAYRLQYGVRTAIPSSFAMHTAWFERNHTAYDWIRSQSAPGDVFYADDDALLYLHTGRKAISLRVPGDLVYVDGGEGITGFVSSLPSFAEQFGVNYALFTGHDFIRTNQEAGKAGQKLLEADKDRFELRFEDRETRVFAIHGAKTALRARQTAH